MSFSNQYFNDDTIVAIATGSNVRSAIGILRISGSKSELIAKKFLFQPSNDPLKSLESHRMAYAHFRDADGKIIDEIMFVYFKGPRSFTGEDSLELFFHGNPLLLDKATESIAASGLARIALNGEFSFRAFQNGKIDLNQAEAIGDLIQSHSPAKAEQNLNLTLGRARGFFEEVKSQLLARLAAVELDIDFSDQGVSNLDYSLWASELESWCATVDVARDEFKRRKPIRDGIRLAIIGAPNSGKSTLFNSLLGADRSIVSEIAGTTRDVVTEGFQVNGLMFRLADTAGIRLTDDKIESEGIRRSESELSSSDLALLVMDGENFKESDIGHWQELVRKNAPETPLIIAINKIDKINQNSLPKIPGTFKLVSAKTGAGIDALLKEIESKFSKLSLVEQPESFAVGRMRHYELLGEAQKCVFEAISKVKRGECFPDLLATDLRSALGFLGQINGDLTPDDVLNHIFSEFCIGK